MTDPVADVPDVASSRRSFLMAAAVTGLVAGVAAGEPVLAQSPDRTAGKSPKKTVLGMVVFDGFQQLDVFGPLEMFGDLGGDKVQIAIIAQRKGPVKSSAGPAIIADYDFSDAPKLDVVMIPGGGGTRREVNNPAFLAAYRALAQATPHVATICTGSAVLARTGLLDGVKATTNKRAYAWATSQGPKVQWVPQARWVEDGKYFTSSGISAGMDMALGLIARLYGHDAAVEVATRAEYIWNSDPHVDPFAKVNGLAG